MIVINNLYEIILSIYSISLIVYFIDSIQHNRKANHIAFWLLCMVWVIQTIILGYQVVVNMSFPINSVNDSLLLYSWTLILFSLLLNKFLKYPFIIFLINVFGFFLMLFYVSTRARVGIHTSGIQFANEVLITHVALTIVSYVFFTLSFIFSIGYLLHYRLLKGKKQLKWTKTIGNLAKLDAYSFTSVTIGVPLLMIGLMLGFIWGYVSNDEFYLIDMKIFGSILVFIVYNTYLFLRIFIGYQGKSIARFNTIAFLILLVNFFLFSLLSNFHF